MELLLPPERTEVCCPGITGAACQGAMGLQLYRRGRKDCLEPRGFPGASLVPPCPPQVKGSLTATYKRQDCCGLRPSGMKVYNPNQLRAKQHGKGREKRILSFHSDVQPLAGRQTVMAMPVGLPACACKGCLEKIWALSV